MNMLMPLGRGVRTLLAVLLSAALLCGCESVPSLSSLQGRGQIAVPGLEGLYEITDRTVSSEHVGNHLAIRREPGREPGDPPSYAIIAFKRNIPIAEADSRAERCDRWRGSVHAIGGSIVVECVNTLTPFREVTFDSEVAPGAVLPIFFFSRLERSGATITLRELGDDESPWISRAVATVPGFRVLQVNGNPRMHGDPKALERALAIALEAMPKPATEKVLLEARRTGPLPEILKRPSGPSTSSSRAVPPPQPPSPSRSTAAEPRPAKPATDPTTLLSATVQIGNILTPYIRAVTVPADGTLTLSVLSLNHESIDIDLIPEDQLGAWKRVEPYTYFANFHGERVLRQTFSGRLRGATKAYLVARTQIQQEHTATVDIRLSFTPNP